MRPTGFSPVTRPYVAVPSVKFRAELSGEEEVERVLDNWLEALERGEVELVRKNDGNAFTVKFKGQLYRVEGLGAPNLGTMPESLYLESLQTQERLHYTGPGCFGLATVTYKGPASSDAPDSAYGETAYKAAKVIRELGKLAGLDPEPGN